MRMLTYVIADDFSVVHVKDMGLGSVYMWGALESMRMIPELDHTELLQLPEDFEPLIALAIGYPAKELEERKMRHQPFECNLI